MNEVWALCGITGSVLVAYTGVCTSLIVDQNSFRGNPLI
jgi:hypothetical protein